MTKIPWDPSISADAQGAYRKYTPALVCCCFQWLERCTGRHAEWIQTGMNRIQVIVVHHAQLLEREIRVVEHVLEGTHPRDSLHVLREKERMVVCRSLTFTYVHGAELTLRVRD